MTSFQPLVVASDEPFAGLSDPAFLDAIEAVFEPFGIAVSMCFGLVLLYSASVRFFRVWSRDESAADLVDAPATVQEQFVAEYGDEARAYLARRAADKQRAVNEQVNRGPQFPPGVSR